VTTTAGMTAATVVVATAATERNDGSNSNSNK